jgi:hypothetical protein
MEFEREVRIDQRERMARQFDGICTWLQGPDVARAIRAAELDSESEPAPLSTVW